MILIQIFLPITDNQGHAFSREIYTQIKETFTEKFGGVTSFSQSPAEGLWEKGEEVQKDQILIYEVMATGIDKGWWSAYKKKLEQILKQENILIRWFDIAVL